MYGTTESLFYVHSEKLRDEIEKKYIGLEGTGAKSPDQPALKLTSLCSGSEVREC